MVLRERNIEGQVLAQFTVDTLGHAEPRSFTILRSSDPQFAAAVYEVLPKFLFYAAEKDGHKVRMIVQQPFIFRLTR